MSGRLDGRDIWIYISWPLLDWWDWMVTKIEVTIESGDRRECRVRSAYE